MITKNRAGATTVEMTADVPYDAYVALMSGEIEDNNGLRYTHKGNFFPHQPSLRHKPTVKEELQQIGVNLVADVAYDLTFEIVCPAIKCFASEEIYPALVQKWHDWLERKAEKKREAEQNKATATRSPAHERGDLDRKRNVINLSDYRKGA